MMLIKFMESVTLSSSHNQPSPKDDFPKSITQWLLTQHEGL